MPSTTAPWAMSRHRWAFHSGTGESAGCWPARKWLRVAADECWRKRQAAPSRSQWGRRCASRTYIFRQALQQVLQRPGFILREVTQGSIQHLHGYLPQARIGGLAGLRQFEVDQAPVIG